ncbi:ABC transporter ATP-binding protein [Thermoleptolyngbya oregonensis NK1-22]|uniref:ABC transporter ATP-binding protein n=1 Tax=Thermoleptolyngbya oregonensis NK1-22 TaxID=2547457 RepID=A0AA96Y7E3_9CYAN|nr:ABC transporter ATP-binding protein [Thermoleptolyngbya oregonensis]WOB45014.1 ABC transporter ATP-binding protein [Thermoleptolyngbya oregonensis NK1-22]
MARIALNQITRIFNATTAIADITFEVPDGQFWVMVGPSGCGKSTILRTIAGLEMATSGDLYIGDRRVNDVPARQRDVAMVFQNYALYPHMTVAENLAFGLRMRGADVRTIQSRIEAVAQSLGLTPLLDRKPGQLSGGQQQRVALGRAIARKPQAFLMDEPLSNLDAQLRDDTRAELKQLHQQLGITTLYVTHDQTEAMTLADQIVVLNQGRIQQIGPPQEIYQQPANQMVATFVGNPPMNLLNAVYLENRLHIGEQVLPCPAGLQSVLGDSRRESAPPRLRERVATRPGRSINLGIRPEQLQIAPDEIAPDGIAPDGEDGRLVAQVTLVEPLGRETLVRAKLPGVARPINLLAAPERAVQVGDRLSLRFDERALVGFDPETGDRLL